MAETNAILVGEILGFKPSDEGPMLFGMKDHEGHEFALALPPAMLRQFMVGLIQANGTVEQTMTLGEEQQLEALPVKWFNFGEADQQGFGLQFQLDPMGQIAFFLDPQITQRLAEVLAVATGLVSIPPERGKLSN